MTTTIQVDEDVRESLEKLKIHKREAINDVIKQLIEAYLNAGEFDINELREIKKSLIEIQHRKSKKFLSAEEAIKYLEEQE